jgi:hypothetical protein
MTLEYPDPLSLQKRHLQLRQQLELLRNNDVNLSINQIVERTKAILSSKNLPAEHHELRAALHNLNKERCPLSADKIAPIEKKHSFTVPADYRYYLQNISNGGLGAADGILPLEVQADRYCAGDFPCSEWSEQRLENMSEDEYDALEYGLLTIAEYQNGAYYAMVVSGNYHGSIWLQYDYPTLKPVAKNFTQWHNRYLDRMDRIMQYIL